MAKKRRKRELVDIPFPKRFAGVLASRPGHLAALTGSAGAFLAFAIPWKGGGKSTAAMLRDAAIGGLLGSGLGLAGQEWLRRSKDPEVQQALAFGYAQRVGRRLAREYAAAPHKQRVLRRAERLFNQMARPFFSARAPRGVLRYRRDYVPAQLRYRAALAHKRRG